MRFLLGTHMTSWLGQTTVPLFVSHRRLAGRRSWPVATSLWSLDSGGFTELNRCTSGCVSDGSRHHAHGWHTSPEDYADSVREIARNVGRLVWAAPQDWMVEPNVLTKTGLTVTEHQRRTVDNFLRLRSLAPDLPFIPVLQGWTLTDYHRCIDLYDEADIDLRRYPVVGVGSLCRRQHTEEIGTIVASLAARGLRLHGFGVKRQGLERYGHLLVSADSMAWSYSARRRRIRSDECTHPGPCNNCLRYALNWRSSVLDAIAAAEPKAKSYRIGRPLGASAPL